MPEPVFQPHLVTNDVAFVGPFNDRESAYAYLIQQGVTGWRVELLATPVLPG